MNEFNLKLHHIGVATDNLEKEAEFFKLLGYNDKKNSFTDNYQGVKGFFLEKNGQPDIELIENIEKNGPLTPHLSKGRKFYHLAYETSNIENSVKNLIETKKAMVIYPINSAETFEKICFLMFKNSMIIELVQLKKESTGEN